MITTTISHIGGAYLNTSPFTFTITFSEDVTGFTSADINVTGGSIILVTGSGSVYTATVSPLIQGSNVLIQVLANVAQNNLAVLNNASNIDGATYNSIKPRPVITHSIKPITNSQFANISIVFDKVVTGFTLDDIITSNVLVSTLTGSGTTYEAKIILQGTGESSFHIQAGAATDLFGNTSLESLPVKVLFDSYPIKEKSLASYNEVTDPDILMGFDIKEIHQVSAISSIADCAKNIPQRLLEMAEEQAFNLLLQNPNVQQLVGTIDMISAKIEQVQSLIEQVQTIIDNPETLLQSLLEMQGLTGEALRMKTQYIADRFSSVTGLDSIIGAIQSTGICGQPNYFADGSFAPRQVITPTNIAPPPVPGISTPIMNTYDSAPKDNYDDFIFRLKESLEVDSVEAQSSDRAAMISLVMTLVMGYHDDIVNANDSSKDDELYNKFLNNVKHEKERNLTWDEPIKTQFDLKTNTAGNQIKNNTSEIRTFMNRNRVNIGSAISIGVTTYSGPADDFTTFLDIKPEQRPAELTAKYKAQGKKIPSGDTYTNSKGKTFKIGTLDYSEAFTGAYGASLISDYHVASTRFPGGSFIALKNSDGTPYNPSGKNQMGKYLVADTGNAELTYKKPDIFTLTPELYKNTEKVHVFLISEGSKKGKQYNLAQRLYANKGLVA